MRAKTRRVWFILAVCASLAVLSACVRAKPARVLPPVEQVFGAPAAQVRVLEPTATPLAPLPTLTPTDLPVTAEPTATAEPTTAPTLAPPTSVPATTMPTSSPTATASPTPPPTATATAVPQTDLLTYVVSKGDTLYTLAKRHGTSVQALQEVNGLGESDRINYGQTILLPADAVLDSGPIIKTTNYWINHGDTLTRIAQRYHTTTAEIMAANPSITDEDAIYVGMRIIVPIDTASSRVHLVLYGESLSGIATRYGVSVKSLVEANDLSSANSIFAGQRLVIPD